VTAGAALPLKNHLPVLLGRTGRRRQHATATAKRDVVLLGLVAARLTVNGIGRNRCERRGRLNTDRLVGVTPWNGQNSTLRCAEPEHQRSRTAYPN
jgi:hypothetical protein